MLKNAFADIIVLSHKYLRGQMEKVGDKIFKLRVKQKMSQEQLGARIGVTRQTISQWEANIRNIQAIKVILICNVFEVPLEHFVVGDNLEEIGITLPKDGKVVDLFKETVQRVKIKNELEKQRRAEGLLVDDEEEEEKNPPEVIDMLTKSDSEIVDLYRDKLKERFERAEALRKKKANADKKVVSEKKLKDMTLDEQIEVLSSPVFTTIDTDIVGSTPFLDKIANKITEEEKISAAKIEEVEEKEDLTEASAETENKVADAVAEEEEHVACADACAEVAGAFGAVDNIADQNPARRKMSNKAKAWLISFMIPISIVLITIFGISISMFPIHDHGFVSYSSTFDFGPRNICKIIIGFIVVMWIVAIMAKIIYKILEKIDVKRNKIKR